MSEQERLEFRLFCEQATDTQLCNIVEQEREAAEGSEYRAACAGIAEAVASSRGLWF
jgi:hypothetical protein